MTDLNALADSPHPPFTCRQFSSYDRAARSPSDNWFANGDAGHFLRVEQRAGRKEHVLMDAQGPGAVVRIWSANPAGTLRVYLDGQEKPALEAPMADLLAGRVADLPTPLAGERSRGFNLYFPLPYARHCKVTSDAGGFYFHVNYRTYPAGTRVQTFRPDDLKVNASTVSHVAQQLSAPRAASGRWPGRRDTPFDVHVPAGESRTVFASDLGGQCVVELVTRVTARDPVLALRQTILELSFDGAAAVSAPLGDFFGAAPGVNAYESLPMGVTAQGEMWCHWVMPFERTAEMRLINLGNQDVQVHGLIALAPRPWTGRSLHFHAKWRGQQQVPTRPMQDWNYLDATGSGAFVGVAFNIANPVKQWWGEGDEKIYVDGEKFPSHFGTGTEDYYGYAWCCNLPFTHAYHNQPRCDGPGNYGHTSVNRWHVLDCIPFRQSLRFDMELWHWHERCNVDMAVTAYWYARPGGSDAFAAIRPEDVRLRLLEPYQPARVPGVIEGEELRIVEKTGVVGPQDIEPCSNERHLWWREAGQPGARLKLAFQAPAAGHYRVLLRCLKAADYGISQLYINDRKAGPPIDLYNDGIVLSDELDLGVVELKQGDNFLTAEIVGANEKAIKGYMFGLDYLRLKPLPHN